MKKYSLAVVTEGNPLPRICDFTVTGESVLAYEMQSALYRVWVRKGTLKRILAEGAVLRPSDCEIFHKR